MILHRAYLDNALGLMLICVYRSDLKLALQEKDRARLAVLRNLMAQITNASKTATPITTDVQMLGLLRKALESSKMASQEFAAAGRQELAEKENTQVKIMEEYASKVETLPLESIELALQHAIKLLQAETEKQPKLGELLKRVFAADILGEKAVERATVAKLAQEMLQKS